MPWSPKTCNSHGPDKFTLQLSLLWFFFFSGYQREFQGPKDFCYNKVTGIISSHFSVVVPTATLPLKAVKGSQSIRKRIKYNLQTTSPLHSYVIAHSVCDLKHENLTLSLPPQSHNDSSSNYSISCTACTIKFFGVDYILQQQTPPLKRKPPKNKIVFMKRL